MARCNIRCWMILNFNLIEFDRLAFLKGAWYWGLLPLQYRYPVWTCPEVVFGSGDCPPNKLTKQCHIIHHRSTRVVRGCTPLMIWCPLLLPDWCSRGDSARWRGWGGSGYQKLSMRCLFLIFFASAKAQCVQGKHRLNLRAWKRASLHVLFQRSPLDLEVRLGVLVPGRESALASWPSMSRHSLLHFLSDVLMFDVFFLK